MVLRLRKVRNANFLNSYVVIYSSNLDIQNCIRNRSQTGEKVICNFFAHPSVAFI